MCGQDLMLIERGRVERKLGGDRRAGELCVLPLSDMWVGG